MFHCRVMCAGKCEADIGFLQAFRQGIGRSVDADSQLLQHVRRSRSARCRAIAVLHHSHARARHDQRGGGGDVERPAHVPAGAAGVEDHAVRIARNADRRLVPHDRCRADELFDGGSLGSQADEQPADLGVFRLARHDMRKCLARFRSREIFATTELQENVAK